MKLLVHICLYHRFILFLNHFKTFTVETPDKYKEVKHYQDIFFFSPAASMQRLCMCKPCYPTMFPCLCSSTKQGKEERQESKITSTERFRH